MVEKIESIHQEGTIVEVKALDKKQEDMDGPCKRTKANMKKKSINQEIQELKKIALNMTQL